MPLGTTMSQQYPTTVVGHNLALLLLPQLMSLLLVHLSIAATAAPGVAAARTNLKDRSRDQLEGSIWGHAGPRAGPRADERHFNLLLLLMTETPLGITASGQSISLHVPTVTSNCTCFYKQRQRCR
jgi:hypothetical protein